MSLAVAAGCPFFRRVGTVAGAGLVLGVAGSISIGRCESEADAASGGEQRRSEKFASLGAAVMEGPMGTLPPPPADKAGSDRPEYDGRPRVAFQGELGAYSEMAVTQHYGEGNAVPVPCDDFEELVRLVSSGQVERGLIPIENTLAGTIHKNYDLLLAHSRIHIVGEVTIHIEHCLLALESTQMSDIKRVLSHPVALAQCERFLAANGLQPEVSYDTAGSAKLVAERGWTDAAAIAGKAAAVQYGLKVLQKGVQDESNNYTRFLELSTEAAIVRQGRAAMTSLLLALPSRPGSLVHALTILSMRGLNMTKLESRPVNSLNEATRKMIEAEDPEALGQFPAIFLIDVAGSIADVPMKNAIAHLHEEPIFMRVLGSYEI